MIQHLSKLAVLTILLSAVQATAGIITQTEDYTTTPVAGTNYVSAILGVEAANSWGIGNANLFGTPGYLWMSANEAASAGSLQYDFSCPDGNQFSGNFLLDLKMGAGIYYDSWGSAEVSYSLNGGGTWTSLKKVTTQNGTDWDGNIGYSDLYSGQLSFGVAGANQVLVKFDQVSRYYCFNSQVASATFTGTYDAIPEPAMGLMTLAGGLLLAARNRQRK